MDSANALRVTITRLRRQLRKEEAFQNIQIIYEQGSYRLFWGREKVEIDGELMRDKYEQLMGTKEEGDVLELMREICSLYQGEFLPSLSGEAWVESLRSSFQDMYMKCSWRLGTYLMKEGLYEELLKLCDQSLGLCPQEEWLERKIQCLIQLNRFREAGKACYDPGAFMSGYCPSEEWIHRFGQLGKLIEQSEKSGEDIRESLMERSRETGACCCTYPGFADCFHMYSGMADRRYAWGYLFICSIRVRNGKMVEQDSDLKAYTEMLCSLLHRQLRRGDIYAVHSPGRILVLLTGLKDRHMGQVKRRIISSFWTDSGQKAVLKIEAFPC